MIKNITDLETQDIIGIIIIQGIIMTLFQFMFQTQRSSVKTLKREEVDYTTFLL